MELAEKAEPRQARAAGVVKTTAAYHAIMAATTNAVSRWSR
jgi:hypothetical protein